jgi:hypothetical protein
LNAQKSISEIIKHIKGLSSHYLNTLQINAEPFAWQKGYSAISISEENLPHITRFNYQQERLTGFTSNLDFEAWPMHYTMKVMTNKKSQSSLSKTLGLIIIL